MTIKLQLPRLTELKPRIAVMGIGGAGGNAINNMIAAGLTGVEFIAANTDAQALLSSSADHRVQLGIDLTEGLGAGSRPEIGAEAAEEAADEIRSIISGAHMLFVTAGMGGGTGSGAAAVVARIARELDILVVAVVTKPFQFEGSRRMRIAEAGIEELRAHVDTMIVIPNQNLFRVTNERTTFSEAFLKADQVLYSGIACIVDLILKEGLINLDFADVRAVMKGMGSAMMGTGEASGDDRALRAACDAIANPLLEEVSLRGARGLLVSITGDHEMTLHEVDQAASRVREEVDPDANIIVGATYDATLGDRIRVSIVASGMPQASVDAHPVVTTTSAAPRPAVPGNRVSNEAASRGDAGQPAGAVQRPAPASPPPVPQFETDRAREEEIARESLVAALQDIPRHVADRDPDGSRATAPPNELGGRGEPYRVNSPAPAGERPADRHGFTPAPPAPSRGGSRRVPGIDEFPPVAQRAYKAAGERGYDRAEANAPPARGGFFGRIKSGWSATEDADLAHDGSAIRGTVNDGRDSSPRVHIAPSDDEVTTRAAPHHAGKGKRY
jgi:cell division protein FtsZ